ncbi:hypothetical protein [Adhaeribacter pallidiroseus]|uniref:Uncharacterized protein n=1 Tax=Adhaeribacter pallidiroseus TaxID=2072847 RepID=A0A369QTL5_9BACT|nr:hypothetical protein [Adhaeribacter pallidiroseus]RDC65498.1 hypothetical protein AHMF7616_04128 [Adhaeribacter pallidiroseus]
MRGRDKHWLVQTASEGIFARRVKLHVLAIFSSICVIQEETILLRS